MNQIIIDENEYEYEMEKKGIDSVRGESGLIRIKITDEDRISHLQKYLRPKIGDTLRLAIINRGRIDSAKVVSIDYDQKKVILEFNKKEIDQSLPKTIFGKNFQVIMGLSRPPTLKKIFEHGATLGVNVFHLISTSLTEKSYQTSRILNKDEYDRFFKLGLSQSALYYNLPIVNVYECLKSFHSKMEEEATKSAGCTEYNYKSAKKFILSTKADKDFKYYADHLKNAENSKYSQLTLSIGPERGFTKEEEAIFIDELQFIPIKISNSILRVEHAFFYAVAQLELLGF